MSSAPTESVPTVDVPVNLENVGQCHPHQHEVQFYFDDRFLVRSLAEYVSNALDAGGSAVIVATQAHRESLAKELERAGIDLSAATAKGRFVLLDAAATLAKFMVDGSPEEAPFRECVGTIIALAAGAARPDCNKVVVFGEMVTLLLQRSDAASVVRLEQFWNRLCEVHSFRLRCGYPLASFDRQIHTELFSQICGEHHMVIPAESYTDLSDENERRRTVARLQQKEQVLKTEAVERRTAQAQKQRIENENMQLMEEIRKREAAEDELRRFTRRLLSARDEEQRRIAGELHENTAQLLAALSLYFGVLLEEKGSLNPKLASVVASSRMVSDNLLREIRKLSHLLHPPTLDDMGLGSALLEYVEQRRASSKARIELDIAEDLGRFPRKLEIAVFRIIEEALAGIPANCEGVLAIVHLTRSTSALEIRIENRRTGTYSAAESSSRADTRIMGIHERAQEYGGSVQFSSDPTGTVLRVILPLAAQKPTHA
jgi:signal transduction histidine kinase